MQPMRRRRFVGRVGVWLAATALLIQSALPLADAAFHAAFSVTGDDDGFRVAAAPAVPGDALESISKQAPVHLAHDCPICQFISTLGSFAPPTVARAATPTPVDRFAVWPTAPPAVRLADASAAQPRAPPALI